MTPYLHDAQYATRLLGAVLCLQFSVPPFLVSLFPVPQFLVPHMPAAQFPASQSIVCLTITRPIAHRRVHLYMRDRPEACLKESFGQSSGSREEIYEIVAALFIHLRHTSSSQSSSLKSTSHFHLLA
ncbi:hypothetical protein ACTQ2Z_08180 [Bifidobacterium boum]|uniref:hypothetical protein n=1 Tax=Bifidobacterium boum TaxID=78343 RepID=UPI003F920317